MVAQNGILKQNYALKLLITFILYVLFCFS